MHPRVFAFRLGLSLTICTCVLLVPLGPLVVSDAAQGRNAERMGRPKPGKPEGVWPDLEEVQQEFEREAPPPIPSTVRSPRNSGKPWDGRRVGDPGPPEGERGSQTRRAHARARTMSPPPPHDQFVQNFFIYGLVRNPFSDETTYWYDQFRVAYGNGATSLKLAGIELGRTLFESAEYAARNRNAHWYVYDLYKTYLMRDPDAGGWAMWEGLVPTHGREYVRRGFEESG